MTHFIRQIIKESFIFLIKEHTMKKMLLPTLFVLLSCFDYAHAQTYVYGDIVSTQQTFYIVSSEPLEPNSLSFPVQVGGNEENDYFSSNDVVLSKNIVFPSGTSGKSGGIGFKANVLSLSQPSISLTYSLQSSSLQGLGEVSSILWWTQDGITYSEVPGSRSNVSPSPEFFFSNAVTFDLTTLSPNIDPTKPFVVYLYLFTSEPSPPPTPITIVDAGLGISYIPFQASTVACGTLTNNGNFSSLIAPFFNIELSASFFGFPPGGIIFPKNALPPNFSINYSYTVTGITNPVLASYGAILNVRQDANPLNQGMDIQSSGGTTKDNEVLTFSGTITASMINNYDANKPLAIYLIPTGQDFQFNITYLLINLNRPPNL